MSQTRSVPSHKVILKNEANQDICRSDEEFGTEIQYTKDYGCGIDCLFEIYPGKRPCKTKPFCV